MLFRHVGQVKQTQRIMNISLKRIGME